MAGRISDAPSIPSAIIVAENVDAVEAATIPRGAIQPTKPRSAPDRSVRSVDAHATSGRVTSTSTATRPTAGSGRPLSDSGVTVAEMEMNSTPMMS